MREAVHNLTKSCIEGFRKQLMHPITGPLKLLFGVRLEMGPYFTKMRENCARTHRQIMKYVQNRKKGLHKSTMNGYDLMSVFLEDQEAFPDEAIAQNLLMFIFAGVETTHYTSQTVISHLT